MFEKLSGDFAYFIYFVTRHAFCKLLVDQSQLAKFILVSFDLSQLLSQHFELLLILLELLFLYEFLTLLAMDSLRFRRVDFSRCTFPHQEVILKF